jgi:hypothetical protein
MSLSPEQVPQPLKVQLPNRVIFFFPAAVMMTDVKIGAFTIEAASRRRSVLSNAGRRDADLI